MATVEEVDVNREIEATERVADYVIDADVHVTPPPGMWREYLSPRFRELAPVVESDGEFDYVVFEPTRMSDRRPLFLNCWEDRPAWDCIKLSLRRLP
jgi:hypothetical protein